MKHFTVFLVIISTIFYGGTEADLASDVKLLKARVEELEKFKATQTSYCSLHASGKCGPCICKDDFNLPERFYCDCQNQPAKRDCLAFYQSGYRVDGIYKITLNGFKTIPVFCDQKYSQSGRTGGWTVIQRRMDGSTNFYRNWQQYKDGFGELQREFWLGNDNIHLLTAQAIYPSGSEAAIKFRNSQSWYSKYSYTTNYFSHFQVDSEKSKYMLHVSSAAFLSSYNNNQPFSTYDKDNDGASSYNCAKDYNYGGWWYNGKGNTCTSSQAAYTNFNGPYDEDRLLPWYRSLSWGTIKLSYMTIMVRRL